MPHSTHISQPTQLPFLDYCSNWLYIKFFINTSFLILSFLVFPFIFMRKCHVSQCILHFFTTSPLVYSVLLFYSDYTIEYSSYCFYSFVYLFIKLVITFNNGTLSLKMCYLFYVLSFNFEVMQLFFR